ncbi:hypothetical protein JKF63_07290 [Porcisia hertigi]|uniref:Chloride channel protein n=1 Tax=Porcisia hertigi TaxID=2761500 RepID=A0A836LLD1_9TRYP|nr:hypothetical protein JKF63_07290 [Porcisia hertigi]
MPTDEFGSAVCGPPPPHQGSILGWFWQTLRETANPNTMHTEDLTPAELERQAGFESLDYHRSYSEMYVTYLREHHKSRQRHYTRDNAAVTSPGVQGEGAILTEVGTEGAERTYNNTGSPLSNMKENFSCIQMDTTELHVTLRWLLHVLIALSVGVVATVVSYAVDIIEAYQAGMLYRIMTSQSYCFIGILQGFFFTVLGSVGLLAMAAAAVVYFEPAASGGGIPDVMAYLNGVHLRKAMNLRTFIAKSISCICAVASGLPVGLEAPLIHLGAIIGAGVTQGRSRTLGFQTSLFQAFRNNKDRRDFITAGAACGVSVAFGAPIGGLLFVMEEVSSFWDQSSSGQIFLATMLCFTFSTVINSIVEDRRLLGWVSNAAAVLFEINLTIPLNLVSIIPSLFLGVIIGSLAAFFTKANLILVKWRRRMLRPYRLRRFLEPVVIGAVFSTSMYVLSLLSPCAEHYDVRSLNETVYQWGTEEAGRLFNNTCRSPQTYSPLGTLNMASGKNTIRHLFSRQTAGEFPVMTLVVYFLIYFAFACVASGTSVSGGLVVPSLVLGATFGRLFGLLMFKFGATKISGVPRGYAAAHAWMDPGVFALIGAGAFLAGTSRMSMAICVIMVELSAELHYLLPVMVAIVMAKTTADWLCEPLYHQMLHMDCVPYLPPNIVKPEFEQLTSADVMACEVVTLRVRERTEVVLAALRDSTHHAFPVVQPVSIDDAFTDASGKNVTSAPAQRFDGSLPTRRDGTKASASDASALPPVEATSTLGPCSAKIPSTVAPTVARVRYKFVGLVTREDLQVYLSLLELREYDDSDDFGGRPAQGGMVTRPLTWRQWVWQKSRLFLRASDRYESVRTRTPDGVPCRMVDVHVEDASLIGDNNLPGVLELSPIVNRSPWVIPPFFNLKMVYQAFRIMGLRHMVVVDGDTVAGVITRKDLLVHSLRQKMRDLGARLATVGSVAPSLPPSYTSRKMLSDPLQSCLNEHAGDAMGSVQAAQPVTYANDWFATPTYRFVSGTNRSAASPASEFPRTLIPIFAGTGGPAGHSSSTAASSAAATAAAPAGEVSSPLSILFGVAEPPPTVGCPALPGSLVHNTATVAPPHATPQQLSSAAGYTMVRGGGASVPAGGEEGSSGVAGALANEARAPSMPWTPHLPPPADAAQLFDLDALHSLGGAS